MLIYFVSHKIWASSLRSRGDRSALHSSNSEGSPVLLKAFLTSASSGLLHLSLDWDERKTISSTPSLLLCLAAFPLKGSKGLQPNTQAASRPQQCSNLKLRPCQPDTSKCLTPSSLTVVERVPAGRWETAGSQNGKEGRAGSYTVKLLYLKPSTGTSTPGS